MNKPVIILSTSGLVKNGKNVLLDFEFKGRHRITSKYKYPEEIDLAYKLRNDLIDDLECNNFKIDYYKKYFKNLSSLEVFDAVYSHEKKAPMMKILFETVIDAMVLKVKTGMLRQEYIDGFKYSLKNHLIPFFGDMKVTQVNKKVILRFLRGLEATHTHDGAKNVLKPLRRALDYAEIEDCIDVSPMKQLPRNYLKNFKKNTRRETFSIEDVELVIATAPVGCIQNIVAFSFWTGCRPCEVYSITAADVNLEKRTICITKSKSRRQNINLPKTDAGFRTIEILEPLIPYLESQLKIVAADNDNTLFKTPSGTKWRTSSQFGVYWKKIIDQLDGIKYLSIKHLRSACFTHLLDKNNKPTDISAMAGHTTTRVTIEHYFKLSKNGRTKLKL